MLKTMLFRGTNIGGSESWVLYFGELGDEIYTINSVCTSKKGVIYVGGSAYRVTSSRNKVQNSYFTKINDKGEILWQNYFSHKSNDTISLNGCVSTIDNNIIIGGQEYSTDNRTKTDTQLSLCSVNGDEIATAGITALDTSGASTAALILGINSSNDNIYVYGENYLAKLTKDLSNADWIKPLFNYTKVNMRYDPDSDCIYFCGNVPFYADGSSMFFCVGSISLTGEQRWVETIGSFDESGLDVCITSDGIYACGELEDYYNKITNGVLAKYTKSGSLVWIKEIIKNNVYLTPYSIGSDSTGNIYIGYVASMGAIIKLSPDGNVLSNIKITDNSDSFGNIVYIYSINIDAKGNLYAHITNSSKQYLIRLTKNDLTRIATTALTIGPLTFENDSSVSTNSSSITTKRFDKGIIDTSSTATNFSLTSSTFTSTGANLTPELYYKG